MIPEELAGLDPEALKELQELQQIMEEQEEMFKHFTLEDGRHRLMVKMINTSDNPIPSYAKEGDSGFDLRANLPDGPVTLKPLERYLVPTGNFFAIPYGWEMQIRPRSGMAAKFGITVLNSPGTIDSAYRGEVKAIIINLSNEEFTINHGDRVCQAVIAPVTHNVKLVPTDSLDETARGTTGFGSSGVQ
jgi:dUTP pyrophosphatase